MLVFCVYFCQIIYSSVCVNYELLYVTTHVRELITLNGLWSVEILSCSYEFFFFIASKAYHLKEKVIYLTITQQFMVDLKSVSTLGLFGVPLDSILHMLLPRN